MTLQYMASASVSPVCGLRMDCFLLEVPVDGPVQEIGEFPWLLLIVLLPEPEGFFQRAARSVVPGAAEIPRLVGGLLRKVPGSWRRAVIDIP